ncbi:metal-dependent hydrolase [Halomarina halobia]|uniref:Metal-dependent hydrolase n=1 Tax=Halomarina halobia TaxID=3033386 RepID=A0ABD6A5X8_9EURY|nr:metal-dependent hydrolase [Halomarina sp. PSR21]
MHRVGHLGFSLLAYAPVGAALAADDPALAVACGVGVLSLASLPDVDLRLPLVSHRGATHTLAFALLVGLLLGAGGGALDASLAVPTPDLAFVGAFVGVFGVCAHLAADTLTPMGVPWLWPLSGRRYTLGIVRSDDAIANYGLLALGALAAATALGAAR